MESNLNAQSAELRAFHLRLGWILLAIFATLGLVLETLHGFKLQTYVGVDSSTRREMWTLAHAHGTLLGVLHLGFAATLTSVNRSCRTASWLISIASALMPAGFFLGGLVFYDGDPGLGILLVPAGAVCLIIAALLCVRAIRPAVVADEVTPQGKGKRPRRG